MSTPRIEEFPIDDDNEEKIANHLVDGDQDSPDTRQRPCHTFEQDGAAGLYLVLGRDHGGACIAVPIEPTHQYSVWRPITAWPCKRTDRSQLDQLGR